MAAQVRTLPAAKKVPGPLVGTLEGRHSKNDGPSVGYARVRFRPWGTIPKLSD
jgi:hypothetical protein